MYEREWPKLPKDESPEATKEAGLSDGATEDVYDADASEALDVDEDGEA